MPFILKEPDRWAAGPLTTKVDGVPIDPSAPNRDAIQVRLHRIGEPRCPASNDHVVDDAPGCRGQLQYGHVGARARVVHVALTSETARDEE
jgi:hypothetical protein